MNLQLATFRVPATPPVGHSLCAGWNGRAQGIADPLFANGIILTDGSAPIVLCAVDWCEISNRTYMAWVQQLADAVDTDVERVAIHCMHPHCTPWPDAYAQQLVQSHTSITPVMDPVWCDGVLDTVASAATAALGQLRPVTQIGMGKAKVQQVASNRRILGSDGKIKAVRWTTTHDPKVRDEPEGLIDPYLKTISFWNDREKLAVLHYYAVHPSSYEDAFVTPDFTGLARDRRSVEDNHVPHLYFTECAGNITAGKYNDGLTANREIFTARILEAMRQSEHEARIFSPDTLEWRATSISLEPRSDMTESSLKAVLCDKSENSKARGRAALMLAYLERLNSPIQVTALHLGRAASIVHLPGEAFIEYQYYAQQQSPDAFVAVPAYGDCGPGYICMEQSFAEGGYEPYDSFVAPSSEAILKRAIKCVME